MLKMLGLSFTFVPMASQLFLAVCVGVFGRVSFSCSMPYLVYLSLRDHYTGHKEYFCTQNRLMNNENCAGAPGRLVLRGTSCQLKILDISRAILCNSALAKRSLKNSQPVFGRSGDDSIIQLIRLIAAV